MSTPVEQSPPCILIMACNAARPYLSPTPSPPPAPGGCVQGRRTCQRWRLFATLDRAASACQPASAQALTTILASDRPAAKSPIRADPAPTPNEGPAGGPERASACRFFFNQANRGKKAKHVDRPGIGSNQINAGAGGRQGNFRASRPQRAGSEGSANARTSKATRARRAGRRAGQGTGNSPAFRPRRVKYKTVLPFTGSPWQ
jgi:hypothetical protein